ncbi:MAG: CHASE2 domain-containing protein [Rhodospirillales bacterium]
MRTALCIGLTVGVLGAGLAALPPGVALEADVGLSWLFRLRGPAPPPDDVAIVAMNRRAADRLDLPTGTREWPRALHADLIARLAQDGAAAIVLDIFFRNASPAAPETDTRLGAAIRAAGRVALPQFAERDTIAAATAPAATVERLITPAPAIASGAAGIGPFPLPKAATNVHDFWAFLTEVTGEPTLPAIAVQLMALRAPAPLADLMTAVGPAARAPLDAYLGSPRTAGDLVGLMRALRIAFRGDPEAAPRGALAILRAEAAGRVPAAEARTLRALVGLYAGPDRRYLNYYGPPRTIRTIPYDAALTGRGETAPVVGKVVFLGLSEDSVTDIRENFPTVFSRDDGIELSGVEILATATANLLTSSSLRPLSPPAQLMAVAGAGAAIGLAACLAAGLTGTLLAILLGAGWLAAAAAAFAAQGLWLPVAIPILLQLPAAILAGLALKYLVARRGLDYYLPRRVAADIARGRGPEPSRPVRGICLATDIYGYTTLAERLDPPALMTLMNAYWGAIGAPVERNGGRILNTAGDSMMCAWVVPPGGDDRAARRAACRAALEMQAAVAAFNAAHPGRALPTRIGLQAGSFVLGPVGGVGHREFGAIGDALNTAARIRDLNKDFGTHVLAAEAVAEGLGDIARRPIGVLPLRGRRATVRLVELTGLAGADAPYRPASGD